LKQGDDLSPLLSNSALENAIRRVEAKHKRLKLNNTHKLLVYADDINLLGGDINTMKKNKEASIVACKELGLYVSAEKTKYMDTSRDQHAGQNQNIKIGNKSFEMAEHSEYLGKTLTYLPLLSRLKSGNACYHSVQNLLSSSLLPKYLKIKTSFIV
jgi:hypothetical protein